MSTAIPCTDCSSISNFPSTGFGPDFKELKKYYESIVKEFRKTETLGRLDEVYQSLDEIFEECSTEGWDGYDAIPIAGGVFLEAKRLIESLPLTSFPMPEVTPEPNGEIGLVWFRANRLVFVASVSGNNEIVYAGLFGANKSHGTEDFNESLPSAIIENLRRLYED